MHFCINATVAPLCPKLAVSFVSLAINRYFLASAFLTNFLVCVNRVIEECGLRLVLYSHRSESISKATNNIAICKS